MIIRELYLNRIRPFYDSDLIKVVVGIRRCGKSVLLRQIQAELLSRGVAQSQIIELNFEDLAFSFIKNEIDLYQYIQQQINHNQKSYLFFDEIQNVDGFEKAVNSFRATFNSSIFFNGIERQTVVGRIGYPLIRTICQLPPDAVFIQGDV
jgi:predicted AAA+ superfamily ATPase